MRLVATDFGTVVIGNGLFGSAAARHLALLGESVAIVGPDEPVDHRRHDGVFASHYDEGRLVRLADRNPSWSDVTRRAIDAYHRLEEETGVEIHHPVGALIVVPAVAVEEDTVDSPLPMMRECDIEHTVYAPGDRSWRARFPQLEFPDTHYVIHEPAPAGHINPRRLIEAQNAAAARRGARVFRELVVGVQSGRDAVTVTTESGSHLSAERVLVAAGAFTNFNHLVPVRLPLTIETEVIALARVSHDCAQRLTMTPTVKYLIDDPVLDSIYMVPPVRYPDGAHYVKLGANTTSDRFPTSLSEVQDWFREGDSELSIPSFETALDSMWPGTTFLGVESKRCILCRTPTGNPIISQVEDSVFVLTGGNGGGAKGSDAWGEMAARLVLGAAPPG